MAEKQFKVEISSDNYVHFTENGVNVISIGFKEYANAESCKYSLLPFCNRLNELNDEIKELKKQSGNLEHTRDFCADVLADFERLEKENKELKQQLESEHTMLDNAILLERTRMGKNSLIQYREAIQ